MCVRRLCCFTATYQDLEPVGGTLLRSKSVLLSECAMRREHRRGPILKLGVFEHAFDAVAGNQQSGKLTLCNFGIKIDERLEPTNLKATAPAADPSEGKN